MKPSRSVVIAAGGTGGHVYPGLAVAAAIASLGDIAPIFVGTPRGFETTLVPEAGYPLELFDLAPIKGGGSVQAARGVFHAARALGHARRFLRACAPLAVVSIGGYAAGPVSLAAVALGVPLVLVEPNSVMGLANQVVAPLARRIYLAFNEARPRLGGATTRLVGVPLRDDFKPRPSRSSMAGGRRVLVLGGSQGAQALNERLPDALGRASQSLGSEIDVVHQAGRGKDPAVRDAYRRVGLHSARVVSFSRTPADDIAWADVIVSRAGAGTLAEIAAVGRPSVLVPLPSASDDHQTKNAASFAATGAAVWLRQDAADSTRLASELTRILGDDALRARMAAAATDAGRPRAARSLALDLLQLVEVA